MPVKKANTPPKRGASPTPTTTSDAAADVSVGTDSNALETDSVEESSAPAPNIADAPDSGADTKSDDDEEVVKSNFVKIRVKDFRGSFGNAFFDDNGVCEHCDAATAKALQEHFPGAEVEVL